MGIESILIVDTETTGLDPKDSQIIEVACVHYDVRSASIVSSFATLIQAEANAAEAVNRISVGALKVAPCRTYAWTMLADMASYAGPEGSVWMAHRADFDRGFIEAAAPELAARMPWVCSKFDVAWPLGKPGASCVEMALAHGVPVVSAHRALTDCMLIAETLRSVSRMGHDVGWLVSQAMRPRVTVRALVSFDEREKAKVAGFSWDGTSKQWTKRVAVDDLATLGLPFKTAMVTQ